MRVEALDIGMLNTLFTAMRAEAEAVVRLGAPDEVLVEHRTAFMRYRGQGHEIAVALPLRPFVPEDCAGLKALFDAAYAQLFGRTIPRLEVEALTWTLSLATDRPLPAPMASVSPLPAAKPVAFRSLFDPATGVADEAAIYERPSLTPGMAFPGPALVVEDETTTVVPKGFDASINALGQIILEDRA